jgi:hypothetical protein
MHLLLQQHPEIREHIRVQVYGGNIDRGAKAEIARLALEDVFIAFGRLERSAETGLSGRDQVLQKMFQMDALVLVHGTISDCREYIPSKLYEYLWANRPVLALTYQNPQLDALIRRYGGYIAPCDQQTEIANTLYNVYGDWQQDKLLPHNLPGISVKQAVDQILQHVAKLQKDGTAP